MEEKSIKSATQMEVAAMTRVLHPERVEQEWLANLKASFQSKILNRTSAYIVVETEAQKQILLKKQADVINSNNKSELHNETVMRGSEPNIWLLLLLLAIGLWRKKFA
jgi:streptomycin 6-kinase